MIHAKTTRAYCCTICIGPTSLHICGPEKIRGKIFSRGNIFARGYFREKIFSREDIFAGRYFCVNSIFAKICSRENISNSLFAKFSSRENKVLCIQYSVMLEPNNHRLLVGGVVKISPVRIFPGCPPVRSV